MTESLVMHEPCRTRGDCYHTRGGCVGGRIQGRKNVESGHIASLGHIYGNIQGRKNVESGHLARITTLESCAKGGRIGGPIGGRRCVELYGNPGTSEGRAKGGRIGGSINGRKNVESGHLARISRGVPSTADGILFRSQTEASFYCVAQELGGEPRAYPPRIDLSDGRSYFPDFVLGRSILGIPANVPIELKSTRNTFNRRNLSKAIEAGALVVYWDEL